MGSDPLDVQYILGLQDKTFVHFPSQGLFMALSVLSFSVVCSFDLFFISHLFNFHALSFSLLLSLGLCVV